MTIHLKVKVVGVRIDPTNNAKALLVEKAGNGKVKLTAVFSTGIQREAILPWKELWKVLFLKDCLDERCLRDFSPDTGMSRIVKDTNPDGSRFRLFFVHVKGPDLVCISYKDLKKALLEIKKQNEFEL